MTVQPTFGGALGLRPGKSPDQIRLTGVIFTNTSRLLGIVKTLRRAAMENMLRLPSMRAGCVSSSTLAEVSAGSTIRSTGDIPSKRLAPTSSSARRLAMR